MRVIAASVLTFEGLEGDLCQCPHWGFVLSGQLTTTDAAGAAETVTANDRSLPLLKPMSEVAGRMSIQVGAHYLEKEQGGRGVLLGGVPGVPPAKVMILGGGIAGVNAAQMAVGMRADVTIYDINNDRLAELDMFFSSQIKTAYASRSAIARAVEEAELDESDLIQT